MLYYSPSRQLYEAELCKEQMAVAIHTQTECIWSNARKIEKKLSRCSELSLKIQKMTRDTEE